MFAGSHPDEGSSVRAEAHLAARKPFTRGAGRRPRYVSERRPIGALPGAELVLFPSLLRGLRVHARSRRLPSGRPACMRIESSMRELLPPAGGLPSFDLERAGPFVFGLLEQRRAHARGRRRDRRRVAAGLTWDRTAAGYLEVYDRALAREPRDVSRQSSWRSCAGYERTLSRRAGGCSSIDVVSPSSGLSARASTRPFARERAASRGPARAARRDRPTSQSIRQRSSVLSTRRPSSAVSFLPSSRERAA